MLRRPLHQAAASALFIAAVTAAAPATANEIGPTAERLFARADSNQDGYISKDELHAIRARWFDRLDSDGDGHVSPAELQAARQSAGQQRGRRLARLAERRGSRPDPQARLAALDRNGDGRISREEFVTGADERFDRLAGSRGVGRAEFAVLIEGVRDAQSRY